jgi:hypothetical protein
LIAFPFRSHWYDSFLPTFSAPLILGVALVNAPAATFGGQRPLAMRR